MLTDSRKILRLFIFIYVIAVLGGCTRFTGTFAYRTTEMDHYERVRDGSEFEEGTHVEWVFVPDSVPSRTTVGIVFLKKKAVWIDISSSVTTVTQLNPNVYGTLITREPGEYQIQLIINNELADSVRYRIIPAAESDPFEQ